MAQIEKRNNSWRVRIRRFGFPDATKTFKTHAMAERWSRQTETEMDKGNYLDQSEADKTLFVDILKRYASEVTPLKRGQASEIIRLKAMSHHPICKLRVSAITSQRIAEFRDERLKKVSPSTVLRDLNVLGHVFKIAMQEWGMHLAKNPVRNVRKPRENKPRDRRFKDGEEEKLFNVLGDESRAKNGRLLAGVTRNIWMTTICRIAIETAMRQSEIVSLKWENIDLEKRTAKLMMTKNGEPRNVPLSSAAIHALQCLPRSTSDEVFPGLTSEAVKRAFMRATRFAEIKDFRFHDLRHEATSRLFEQGLEIMQVAAITGHKTLQMLLRYTHLRAEDLAKRLK